MAALVEGVSAQQLALLRDVSLRLILNHHGYQGWPGRASEPDSICKYGPG
jgi:hypothetical protein